MSTETKVAAPSAKKTFTDLVTGEHFKNQLMAALPKHLTPDRFTRVLLTATIRTPLLLQCTQETMFNGILTAAAAGVEIDGRRAHLIPFKNNQKQCYEAQLIIDYKGIAELIMRSGIVSTIHTDVVCDNDVFEENRGKIIKHTIDRKKERGDVYAAYCIITMRDGSEKTEVMSKAEVDAIRKRSRAGGSGPWVTDYSEMAKKTVFRRASKWVPLSPEIRGVIEAEDEPLDVTPKSTADLSAILGSSSGPAPVDQNAAVDVTATETAQDAKTYTPEDRDVLLKTVESLMLDSGVGETSVMVYVKAQKLAKPGQDEIGSLDTSVLESLIAIIPTLKK